MILDLQGLEAPVSLDLDALKAQLGPEELELAQRTWRGRMVNEHISARIFGSLVHELMRAGVHGAPLFEASAMAREELEHARLCAAVVTALGGRPVENLPELVPLPDHTPDLPASSEAGGRAVMSLARNLLSVCCLSETVAVAQITCERDRVAPPLKPILTRILADEVGHARLGWALLDELVGGMGSAERRELGRYAAVALEALIAHHEAVGGDPDSCPGPALSALGVCEGRLMRAILVDTIDDVIVPRLELAGLAVRPSWAALRGSALAA